MLNTAFCNSSVNDTNWALVPSDPAIFNDMLLQYGVKDTKVQEVFSLDFEDIKKNGPVHGLMFVSRYFEDELPEGIEVVDPDSEGIVFTAQVVTNVCGTLALLAILLNSEVEKGEILEDFLDFTEGFSPINRGLCLGSNQKIRRIHDAYAMNTSQCAEEALGDALLDADVELVADDNFHYVSYIHKSGYLWEVDGLKNQPIKLASCTEDNWLDALKPVLEKKMNSSMENEIAFNLMAVVHDPYDTLLELRDIYYQCKSAISSILCDPSVKPKIVESRKKRFFNSIINKQVPLKDIMVRLWDNIYNKKQVELIMNEFTRALEELDQEILTLEEAKDADERDVARQKWNYFPFISLLLQKGLEKKLITPPKRKREEDIQEEEDLPPRPRKKMANTPNDAGPVLLKAPKTQRKKKPEETKKAAAKPKKSTAVKSSKKNAPLPTATPEQIPHQNKIKTPKAPKEAAFDPIKAPARKRGRPRKVQPN